MIMELLNSLFTRKESILVVYNGYLNPNFNLIYNDGREIRNRSLCDLDEYLSKKQMREVEKELSKSLNSFTLFVY